MGRVSVFQLPSSQFRRRLGWIGQWANIAFGRRPTANAFANFNNAKFEEKRNLTHRGRDGIFPAVDFDQAAHIEPRWLSSVLPKSFKFVTDTSLQ
jgi:hypothetical protein